MDGLVNVSEEQVDFYVKAIYIYILNILYRYFERWCC